MPSPIASRLTFDIDALLRFVPTGEVEEAHLEALCQIQTRHNRKVSQPPDAYRQQAYRDFIERVQTGTDLPVSSRFARRLAWALTYRPPADPAEWLVETDLLMPALELLAQQPGAGVLLGVFDALLQAWRSDHAEELRRFLRTHLPNYSGKRRILRRIQETFAWYCSEYGPRQLAVELIDSNHSLCDVWEFTGLPESTHAYPYFAELAWVYTLHFLRRRLRTTDIEQILGFLTRHGVDTTSKAVLSALIEHLGESADPSEQLPIKAFVLQAWGDPRVIGGEARWYGISRKADRIFRHWITREDLLFFFDVVAQTCLDPKFTYRRSFWLSYLPHISLCRPVLHREAERFFAGNTQAMEYLKVREPATLTGGTREQHAFIIQMGNYTFVEFSTEAACYVYRTSDSLFQLDHDSYSMSELREQEIAFHRQEHIGSERHYWQTRLHAWIEQHVGVQPSN